MLLFGRDISSSRSLTSGRGAALEMFIFTAPSGFRAGALLIRESARGLQTAYTLQAV